MALLETRPTGLTVVSNNAGVDDFGLGLLLKQKQVGQHYIDSAPDKKESQRQFRDNNPYYFIKTYFVTHQ